MMACCTPFLGSLPIVGAFAPDQRDWRVIQYQEKQAKKGAETKERRAADQAEADRAQSAWLKENSPRLEAEQAAREAETARVKAEEQKELEAKAEALARFLAVQQAMTERREEASFQRAAWSGIACYWQGVRDRVVAEVRRSQAYSREFGVVDLRAANDLQKQARFADEHRDEVRKDLVANDYVPMACAKSEAAQVAACIRARFERELSTRCNDPSRTSELVDAALEWSPDMERASRWPK